MRAVQHTLLMLQITVLSILLCSVSAQAQQTLPTLEQQVELARSSGDQRREGEALVKLGIAYAELNRLEEAMAVLTQAYDQATANSEENTRLNALNTLANVYYNSGQLAPAERYFLMLLELDEARGDQVALATTLFNLGHVYASSQQFALSDQSFNRALDLSRELGDSEGEAFALKALGVSAHAQSDPDSSNTLLLEAATLFSLIGNADQAATVYRNLGDIALDAQNFEEAIAYYTEALPYLQTNMTRKPLMRLYRGLAQAYAGAADYERAFIAHQAFAILMQEDLKAQSEEATRRFQAEFETARFADDNARLEIENEKQQLEILFSQQRARLQYLAIALGGLVFALVFVLWQRSRRHASHMAELATVDVLTGLLNRRAIYELGQQEWQRSERFQRALTVLIFDIDHFKSINDGFGHAVGDTVLKVVSGKAKAAVRKTDAIGRIGGEEFLVICTETEAHQAAVLAERIRTTIEAQSFEDMPGRQVTISLGVAERAEDTDLEALIARADGALYEAKEGGRNRVVIT